MYPGDERGASERIRGLTFWLPLSCLISRSLDHSNEARRENNLGEIPDVGVCGLLIYCADCRCGLSIAISGDRWPDHVRLSEIEPLFVGQARGKKGADVRPDFH